MRGKEEEREREAVEIHFDELTIDRFFDWMWQLDCLGFGGLAIRFACG